MEIEDQEQHWISQAQAGDADAYVHLVHKYEPLIRYQLARKIFDRSAIDDVCQEVFMAALKNIGTFDLNKNFLGWLRGIARNQTLKYFEKQHLRHQHEEEASKLHSWIEKEDDQEGDCWKDELKGCLESLKEKNKKWYHLLYLKYEERHSLQELSKEEGISIASIKMSLMRTRNKLKDCILKKVRHV
jgi:RNA polymerase sigma-70 factor (ECF subfamily)